MKMHVSEITASVLLQNIVGGMQNPYTNREAIVKYVQAQLELAYIQGRIDGLKSAEKRSVKNESETKRHSKNRKRNS